MSKKESLDLDRIARGLRAERGGPVEAKSGWFGALELVAEVKGRLRAPVGGGRGTDPAWTERRLLPLTRETLARLEQLSNTLNENGLSVSPLQLAAILLERAVHEVGDEAVAELARHRAS